MQSHDDALQQWLQRAFSVFSTINRLSRAAGEVSPDGSLPQRDVEAFELLCTLGYPENWHEVVNDAIASGVPQWIDSGWVGHIGPASQTLEAAWAANLVRNKLWCALPAPGDPFPWSRLEDPLWRTLLWKLAALGFTHLDQPVCAQDATDGTQGQEIVPRRNAVRLKRTIAPKSDLCGKRLFFNSALVDHHKHRSQKGLNETPITLDELLSKYGIAKPTASRFFKETFGGSGWREYEKTCTHSPYKLNGILMLLSGELKSKKLHSLTADVEDRRASNLADASDDD